MSLVITSLLPDWEPMVALDPAQKKCFGHQPGLYCKDGDTPGHCMWPDGQRVSVLDTGRASFIKCFSEQQEKDTRIKIINVASQPV